MALLEHWRAGRVAEQFPIPHYSKGDGNFNVILAGYLSVYITGDYGEAVKISAFDTIRAMQGGVAKPSYTFYIRKLGGEFGAGNADPTAEYVTFDGDEVGVQVVEVKVSDGTTETVEAQMSVVVQGLEA